MGCFAATKTNNHDVTIRALGPYMSRIMEWMSSSLVYLWDQLTVTTAWNTGETGDIDIYYFSALRFKIFRRFGFGLTGQSRLLRFLLFGREKVCNFGPTALQQFLGAKKSVIGACSFFGFSVFGPFQLGDFGLDEAAEAYDFSNFSKPEENNCMLL